MGRITDSSTFTSPGIAAMQWTSSATEEGGGQVDIQHLSPARQTEILQRRLVGNVGIADQQVGCAQVTVDGRPKILKTLIGGEIDLEYLIVHWQELLRVAASIRSGTITASAMLRRLVAYPRQNGFALALRELGRIERTNFTLDWLRDPALRRRANAGLNKGEARNALARAVFFNRLGEMRDRSFELGARSPMSCRAFSG